MNFVKILGKVYEVDFLDDMRMQGNMGYAQRAVQRIALNTSNSPEQQQDTLLHEVINIIDRELALGFSEETVQRLAVGLHSAGCFVVLDHLPDDGNMVDQKKEPKVWDGAPDNADSACVEWVNNKDGKLQLSQRYTRTLSKTRAREIAEEAVKELDIIESAILKREAEIKEAGE